MKRNPFIYILLAFLSNACTEVFEEDISNHAVNILAPADSMETVEIDILFWWGEIEDANGYELQIVSPNFDNVMDLVLDSVIVGDKFTKQLSPGTYEWRIRGVNSNTETPYVYRSFEIDSTNNLSNFDINVLSPLDGHASSNLSQSFIWEAIYNADFYTFRLYDNGILLTEVDSLTEAQYTYTLPDEGLYNWQVKAINEQSNTTTSWSDINLIIDQTIPVVPYNLSPENEASVPLEEDVEMDFYWAGEIANSEESSVLDLFQLDDNNAFTHPQNIEIAPTDINRNISLDLEPGTYFWRIQSIDKAGNTSSYTETIEFTISAL